MKVDLTITSGTDGAHSGPGDPHYHGEAYDVRSHDLDDVTKPELNELAEMAGVATYGTKQDIADRIRAAAGQ